MTGEQTNSKIRFDRWSYLWLAIGVLLLLLVGPRWIIPLAPWLAPVFLIRFMRSQRVLWGFILLVICLIGTTMVQAQGIMAIPPPVGIFIVAVGALLQALPYLADRLLAPRLPGFATTLAFPLALTALSFGDMSTNPLGSWGALGYTQYGDLALMQLVSITGMLGLTFLIGWFGPVANWAWDRTLTGREMWRGVAVYAGILVLVLAFGMVRLAFFPLEPGTVRVASMTDTDMDIRQMWELVGADREAFRQGAKESHNRYFQGTMREAQAGAKIVLWSEVAGLVDEADEAELIARGQEVARQEEIYLAMPLYTIYQDPQRPIENKLFIIDPAGEIVVEHLKYGGNMFEGSLLGDGVLHTVETPYGTLSGVICWDADFPAIVRQAGRDGIDILLVPSGDWREIDPLHTQMAVFRAIENGVSLVRQVNQGLSLAADPYGRVLAVQDHFTGSERVMVAQVPTQGVSTIYPVIGDLLGWLAVAGFAAVVIWAIVRGRRAA